MRKIIIPLIVLILLVQISSALVSTNPQDYIWYENAESGSINSTLFPTSNGVVINTTDGYGGSSKSFQAIKNTDAELGSNQIFSYTNFTLQYMIYVTADTDCTRGWSQFSRWGGDHNWQSVIRRDLNTTNFVTFNGWNFTEHSTTFTAGNWYKITLNIDTPNSDSYLYIDDVMVDNYSVAGKGAITQPLDYLFLFSSNTDACPYLKDNYVAWAGNKSEEPQGTLKVNLTSPIDNSSTTNNVTFEFEDGFVDITNCSLYIDGVLNRTQYNNSDFVVYNISEGSHNWSVNCSEYGGSTNLSETDYFYVDITEPSWVTDFVNHTMFYEDNITFQFNFTDNIDINSLQVLLDDSRIFFNLTDADLTSYGLNISNTTNDLAIGSHNLSIRVADGNITDLNIVERVYTFYKIDMTETYEAYISEDVDTDFELIVDFGELLFDTTGFTPTALLEFNQTNNTATLNLVNTTMANFTITVSPPNVTGLTIVDHRWHFDAASYTDDYISTNITNQTLYNWVLDDCSAYGNVTAFFEIFDEDLPSTPLNASLVEVEVIYWIDDSSLFNYTSSANNVHNFSLCIDPENVTLNLDIYLLYTVNFTHRYIISNTTFNGTQRNYTIYNMNITTPISDLKITIRNEQTYNYYPNVIGRLQRRYVSEGVWRTVQMDITGDYGLLFFNIYEQDIDYRLIYLDQENNVLRTTQSMRFSCTSGVCDITTLLSPYEATSAASDTTATYTLDNTTGTLNISFENALGDSVSINYFVRRDTMTGSEYLCEGTIVASSGNIGCNVSGYTGEIFISARSGDTRFFSRYLKLNTAQIGDLVGNYEGGIWAIAIIITILGIGIFSPAGAIVAMMIGLISIFAFGLFTPLTIGIIIVVGILGTYISFKVKS